MSVLQHELSYHHDSAKLFERIKDERWAMLLDSGQLINAALATLAANMAATISWFQRHLLPWLPLDKPRLFASKV